MFELKILNLKQSKVFCYFEDLKRVKNSALIFVYSLSISEEDDCLYIEERFAKISRIFRRSSKSFTT